MRQASVERASVRLSAATDAWLLDMVFTAAKI